MKKLKLTKGEIIMLIVAAAVLIGVCAFYIYKQKKVTGAKYSDLLSADRIETLKTIKKISDYEDLNIYSMEVKFDYSLDRLTPQGPVDTQQLMEAYIAEAVPGVKVDYTAPDYGCSAFCEKRSSDGGYTLGRNYDFKFDSSAMVVTCHPKDGYASIATAAIDNLKVNDPFSSDESLIACLASPFICIDGINEKGVGIAVLTLDSEPVVHNTGKPVLGTTMLIRVVLDKAASTEEAIDLIGQYDMFAIAGRDYHFFITDSTGDSRVVEFDFADPERKMVVTPTRTSTNFYLMYIDKVLPNQKNGLYGHGRERYDTIETILTANEGKFDSAVAWEALKGASQLPNPDSVTSNTQWSIEYDLTNRTSKFVLHRRWDDVFEFNLK